MITPVRLEHSPVKKQDESHGERRTLKLGQSGENRLQPVGLADRPPGVGQFAGFMLFVVRQLCFHAVTMGILSSRIEQRAGLSTHCTALCCAISIHLRHSR